MYIKTISKWRNAKNRYLVPGYPRFVRYFYVGKFPKNES